MLTSQLQLDGIIVSYGDFSIFLSLVYTEKIRRQVASS
jgi:hypothetical protein